MEHKKLITVQLSLKDALSAIQASAATAHSTMDNIEPDGMNKFQRNLFFSVQNQLEHISALSDSMITGILEDELARDRMELTNKGD